MTEWLDKLLKSRDAIRVLDRKWPQDQAITSALLQLDYLIALAQGTEPDDSRLEEIILGYLAMYQLPGDLPDEVSKDLCDIDEKIRRELRKKGRRLRIDRS